MKLNISRVKFIASATSFLALSLLVGLALADAPTITITLINGGNTTIPWTTPGDSLTVSSLPTTVNVQGTLVHDPNTNPVKKVKLYVDTVFASEQTLPLNVGDTFNFSLPWTITTAGSHTLAVTAKHGNCSNSCIGVDEEVLTVINLGGGGGDGGGVNCPAAPAIAAHYLKDILGIKSGSTLYKNIVSLVALHMGPQTMFDGIAACTQPAYTNAVKAFVDANLTVPK